MPESCIRHRPKIQASVPRAKRAAFIALAASRGRVCSHAIEDAIDGAIAAATPEEHLLMKAAIEADAAEDQRLRDARDHGNQRVSPS
jgi:hypothetical protein